MQCAMRKVRPAKCSLPLGGFVSESRAQEARHGHGDGAGCGMLEMDAGREAGALVLRQTASVALNRSVGSSRRRTGFWWCL